MRLRTFIRKVRAFAFGLAASVVLTCAAHAEPGVFDDRIVFGQSAAFDGPAAALGLGMRAGILAAFGEANAAGGSMAAGSSWSPTTTATSRRGRSRIPTI